MIGWQTFFLIGTLFITAGAAFDKLLTAGWKRKLHYKLVYWWDQLDETAVPDLFARVSFWLLRQIDGLTKSPRAGTTLYFGMTTIFFMLSSISGLIVSKTGNVHFEFPEAANVKLDIFDRTPLPHVLVYLAIFPIDFGVVWLSIISLRCIRFGKHVSNFAIIIANLALTVGAVIICWAVIGCASKYAFNHALIGMKGENALAVLAEPKILTYLATNEPSLMKTLLQNGAYTNGFLPLTTNAVARKLEMRNVFWADLKNAPKELLNVGLHDEWQVTTVFDGAIEHNGKTLIYERTQWQNINRIALLMTGTVCIPAILFTVFLIFLLISKLLLTAVRGVAMYFLDLATEPNPTQFVPGTLIGMAFTALLSFMKFLSQMMDFFRNSL